MDPCNTVLPLSAKKASEQALARTGSKAWVSNDAKHWGRNLKGKKEALKQNSWDAVRVWWLAVLVRGKLHVEAPHCPEIDSAENACSNRGEKTIFDRTSGGARSRAGRRPGQTIRNEEKRRLGPPTQDPGPFQAQRARACTMPQQCPWPGLEFGRCGTISQQSPPTISPAQGGTVRALFQQRFKRVSL